MPVFEYRCNECNTKFEFFHKTSATMNSVECPSCSSKNNKKLLSTFSASVGSSSSYAGDSCATGSCGIPSSPCASGMCGLN